MPRLRGRLRRGQCAARAGEGRRPLCVRPAPHHGHRGKVTFKHGTHVKLAAPDCTSCHPKLFKIIEKGKTADGAPFKHARMKKGEQCGTCHNDEKAFGFDDCEKCHASE